MIVVPFVPAHLDDLSLQPGQSEMLAFIEQPGYAEWLASIPGTYSMIKDGSVVMIGGLIDQGNGRALAWSLVSSKLTGFDMVMATRYVISYFKTCPFRRIEAIVKCGFDQGARWAKLLGFKCETPDGMVNWFNDGTRAYLFARSGA